MQRWVLVALSTLTACGGATTLPPQPPCTRQLPIQCAPWASVQMALSTTLDPVPPDKPVLVVRTDSIVLEDRIVATLPPRWGDVDPTSKPDRTDLVIGSLKTALRERRTARTDGGAIVIAFHQYTAYRTVLETTYTAGQAGVGLIYLAAYTSDGKVTGLRVSPPTDREPARLEGSILVSWEGIAIQTPNGNVAEGCMALGPGIAIPIVKGPKSFAHDYRALAECAARLVDNATLPKQASVVVSLRGTTYQISDLVKVLDAIRPSYGNVRLGFASAEREPHTAR